MIYLPNKTLFLVLIVTISLSIFALDPAQYTTSQFNLFIWCNHAANVIPATVWNNLTNLGHAAILIPLLAFFTMVNPRVLATLFGSTPVATILCRLGKKLFAIPRPAAIIDHDQFHIISKTLVGHNSSPSGHSITIFTAVFSIILVYLKDQEAANKSLLTAVALTGALVGFSRVAVGAHWPLDVVFGAALGYIAALSGEYLSRRYFTWWNWITTKPHIFSCFNLLFPVAIIIMIMVGKLEFNTASTFAVVVGVYVSANISIKSFRIVHISPGGVDIK